MNRNTGRTRMRAPERREAILEAAELTFARLGYRVAGMAEIAAAAGITQPMLYRHFTSKKELFLAVLDRCTEQILAAWRTMPDLLSMGEAYMRLAVARPHVVRLRMHALAECEDEGIRQRVQDQYRSQVRIIREAAEREVSAEQVQAGVTADSVTWLFTALGMLIDTGVALNMAELPAAVEAASTLFFRACDPPVGEP